VEPLEDVAKEVLERREDRDRIIEEPLLVA
jgi:hypothetical protein